MKTSYNNAKSQESKQQLCVARDYPRHLLSFRYLTEMLSYGFFLTVAFLPVSNYLITEVIAAPASKPSIPVPPVKGDPQTQSNDRLVTCLQTKCYPVSGVSTASTSACIKSCVASINNLMDASNVAASSAVVSAKSQSPASGVVAAGTPSDNYDWSGDKIWLGNDIVVYKNGASTPEYFAPDGSVFVVSKDNQSTKKLYGKFTNIHLLQNSIQGGVTIEVKGTTGLPWMASWGGRNLPTELVRQSPSDKTPVDTHGEYEIDKSVVENMDHARYGWAFGVLTVPFKFQTSDKSLSGPLSIGPYIGYRFEDYSSSITPILSAGFTTNIPVALANGGGTANRSGISYAVGLVYSIDKGTGIQIGLLAGQDRLGSNTTAPYPYEGKTWVSLAIGAKIF